MAEARGDAAKFEAQRAELERLIESGLAARSAEPQTVAGTPMDVRKLAELYGAVSYSPPPLRAVRGVSFTFEQLDQFVIGVQHAARSSELNTAASQAGKYAGESPGIRVAPDTVNQSPDAAVSSKRTPEGLEQWKKIAWDAAGRELNRSGQAPGVREIAEAVATALYTLAPIDVSHERSHVEALTAIKALVCGEKVPNWADDSMTYYTRGKIADLCDVALGNAPSSATRKSDE